MAEYARRLGMAFYPEWSRAHRDFHQIFPAFGRGSKRGAYNTISGPVQVLETAATAVMGDYTFTTTTGHGDDRQTHTHRFSYVIVALPFRTPQLAVRREGFFDKIAGVVGYTDINFESAQFSRRFHVSASDKKFAYDVIDPRMIGFLMNFDPPAFELAQGRLLVSGGSSTWTPQQFDQYLAWCRGVRVVLAATCDGVIAGRFDPDGGVRRPARGPGRQKWTARVAERNQ